MVLAHLFGCYPIEHADCDVYDVKSYILKVAKVCSIDTNIIAINNYMEGPGIATIK